MKAKRDESLDLKGVSITKWKFFYRYLVGFRRTLIFSSLGYISISFLIIPNLLIVKYIFDKAIPNQYLEGLIYSGLALVGIRLISVLSTLFLRRVSLNLTSSMIGAIRKDLLKVIYSYNYLDYIHIHARRFNTKMVQDTERIAGLFTTLSSRLGPSIVISITLIILLLVVNKMLFLIIALFIPFIAYVNFLMGKRVKAKTEEYQMAFEDFSNSSMFNLKFLALIWLENTETEEAQKHKANIDNLRIKTLNQGLFGSFQTQTQTFLVSLLGISVMVFGGVFVATGQLSLGNFFAFYIAANQLNNQLNAISGSYSTIISGNVSLAKLYDLFQGVKTDTPVETNTLNEINSVDVKDLHFSYAKDEILKGFNLEIRKGESIAIIGPNGSGKSTFMYLLLRLIDPPPGKVLINKIDVNCIKKSSYRRKIGVVTQYPMLIPGSIIDNVTYGSSGYDQELLNKCLHTALVDSFALKLENGYDTDIGEDGNYISGGERQKVAIARALLDRPELIILDEPTNHLDRQSINQIMTNIQHLDWKPIVIIISHDEYIVNHVDKVYEISNGKLIRP